MNFLLEAKDRLLSRPLRLFLTGPAVQFEEQNIHPQHIVN